MQVLNSSKIGKVEKTNKKQLIKRDPKFTCLLIQKMEFKNFILIIPQVR